MFDTLTASMMWRRLTKQRRRQAAWLLAIVYVLTVLAPVAGNAFAPGALAAHQTVPHGHQAPGHDHAAGHVHDGAAPDSGVHHDGDHANQLKCCGLACISALPAHHVDIARPGRAPSVTVVFVSQESAGRSPPRLYRPPIS
jgi:hypothetical protein